MSQCKPRPCFQCENIFTPTRGKDAARFCSKRCQWDVMKGPEYNAKISRDTAAARGDMLRDRGEGKSYRKLNGRHEHRTIAEGKIGRPLRKGEIVHHDDNKRNNAPHNLIVLPSQAEHARLHGFGKARRHD